MNNPFQNDIYNSNLCIHFVYFMKFLQEQLIYSLKWNILFMQITFIVLIQICLKSDSVLLAVYQFDIYK